MTHTRRGRLKWSSMVAGILLTGLAVLVGLDITRRSLAGDPSPPTIGTVSLTPALAPVLDGFKAGMSELGYVEGRSVTYVDEGPVGTISQLEAAFERVKSKNVGLILAISTPAAMQARRSIEGTDIPVVFAPVFDPVASDIVPDLRRPGGNMTGVKVGGFIAKQLEWLLTVAPETRRVFVPHNPEDRSSVLGLAALRDAAELMGVEIIVREVCTPAEVEKMAASIPGRIDAVVLLPDNLVVAQSERICAAAIDRQLPLSAIHLTSTGNALLTYGTDFFQVGRQASRLADQILKGRQPRELPVEQADYFLGVNLKVAEAIGIPVPNQVLRRADEIVR